MITQTLPAQNVSKKTLAALPAFNVFRLSATSFKKDIAIVLALLLTAAAGNTQVLYGVTGEIGAVTKYDIATNSLSYPFSFTDNGGKPSGGLTLATNGKFYGMTTVNAYGIGKSGSIFSYDTATGVYSKLVDFNTFGGVMPVGSLLQATDGKLYGVTKQGGSIGYGMIFSYDPATAVYKKLFNFTGPNGDSPKGSLIQASDGKLYGTASHGGSGDAGVLFSFNPVTSAYSIKKSYSYAQGSEGYDPEGALLQAADGKLYGTTQEGGLGFGTLFSFDPVTSVYKKLKDFSEATSNRFYNTFDNTNGKLAQAANGKLYGINFNGIYSYNISTSQLVQEKVLDGTNAELGRFTRGSNLIAGPGGKLYGKTDMGGSDGLPAFGAGVIFSFDPATSVYTRLHSFDYAYGGAFSGGLTQGANGKLYGSAGRPFSELGLIFSFDPASASYTVIHNYSNPEGYRPFGELVQVGEKFYGTTISGGLYNAGVLYSFDPGSSVYTKLLNYSYDSTLGYAVGSLVKAKDGKLYGMLIRGYNNPLVIYSFETSTNTFTILKKFDLSQSTSPIPDITNSMIQAKDGKLYGLTHLGGSNGVGTLFSFDPTTSDFAILKNFESGSNGSRPTGKLTEASNGKLYGVNQRGGASNDGVIFSYDPVSGTYAKLKNFELPNNVLPVSSLTEAANGLLYGTTTTALYSFNRTTRDYTVVKAFGYNNSTGNGLLKTSNGKLYSINDFYDFSTPSRGKEELFSYDPAASTYTVLLDTTKYIGNTLHSTLVEFSNCTFTATASAGTLNFDSGTTYIVVTASGGSDYLYSINDGPYQVSDTFVVGAGTYTIKVKSGSTCIKTLAPVTITVNNTLSVSVIAPKINCNGASTELTVTPKGGKQPYTYKLDNGAFQTSNKFSVKAGTYIVTVKDSLGYTKDTSVTITQPYPLTIYFTGDPIACKGGTATYTVGVFFGSSPFLYKLDTAAYVTNNTFMVAAGTHTMMVKDKFGCTGTRTETAREPSALSFKASASPITCMGGTTTLTIKASGGTPTYKYSLNGGSYNSSNVFTALPAGTYNLSVMDAHGCTKASTYNIADGAGPCNSSITFAAKAAAGDNLIATATPNPSAGDFTLQVQGSRDKDVYVLVTDIQGKTVFAKKGSATAPYKFGNQFSKGTYIVHVIQASKTTTLKVIKGDK